MVLTPHTFKFAVTASRGTQAVFNVYCLSESLTGCPIGPLPLEVQAVWVVYLMQHAVPKRGLVKDVESSYNLAVTCTSNV